MKKNLLYKIKKILRKLIIKLKNLLNKSIFNILVI